LRVKAQAHPFEDTVREQPLLLARWLISRDQDELVSVRVHQFADHVGAHNDDLQRTLKAEFDADFERLHWVALMGTTSNCLPE
jgi:hypothetical protein